MDTTIAINDFTVCRKAEIRKEIIRVSGETSKMLAVPRTDFNEKDHAANLGEVRSMVHELNIASASKRNFVMTGFLLAVCGGVKDVAAQEGVGVHAFLA